MTTCIPIAGGVPWLPGPPDWFTANPPNIHRDRLDDPRWRGAAAQGFPLTGGTAEQVSFRALYSTPGGVQTVYFSWHIKVDPALEPSEDRLFVGLRGPGGAAIVIEVKPYGASPAADIINQAANELAVYQWDAGTASWTSGIPLPAWMNPNTRVWVTRTPQQWAVQMRMPISTAGDLLNNAGPNLTDTFGLWYYLLVDVSETSGVVRYEWKPGQPATPAGDISNRNFPNPATWDTFHLSSGAADPICVAAAGIALRYSDVGTLNPVSSQILFKDPPPGPTNTFFARPRNYTSSTIAVNQMTARFRIANWGSVPDANAPWQDIPGGSIVTNTAAIPPLPLGNDPPATQPISFNWSLSAADIANFITGKSRHKCMLVELSGPGLTFLNNSVYRNMDFVAASVFRRAAAIDVRGLAPISPAPRDVYLYVETQNMPERVTTPPPDRPEPDRPREPAGPNIAGGEGQPPPPTFEQQVASLPTYRVHVYHDLGETVTFDGVTRPVFEPQSSFGYYLNHQGALLGWRHSLTARPEAQLQEISPNFYKIVVPNNGSAIIRTEIEALEPGGCFAVVINFVRGILRRLGIGGP